MKALLLDDERPVLESLQGKLNLFCPEVEVVAACQSVDEAITILNEEDIDLLFLDVNLNGESGFDLLEKAKGTDFPSLIFTTAHDEFPYLISALSKSSSSPFSCIKVIMD